MLETLGQYKILDRIGAGGLGDVYRARDTRLGRTVAIRVLAADLAADPERRERLCGRRARPPRSRTPTSRRSTRLAKSRGTSFSSSNSCPARR